MVVLRAEDLPAADGLVIATPATTHAEVVEGLLPRGVPVFVEKPLTTDAASAERIASVAGDRVFVMHKWRYHPGVEAVARIAVSGELGPVKVLRLVREEWGHRHPDTDCIWTLTTHDVTIALAVLGTLPEPRFAVAEREGRQITGLTAILGDEPCVVLETSAHAPATQRDLRLTCRDGVVTMSGGYADHIAVYRGRASAVPGAPAPELRAISRTLPLQEELRVFVEYLRGGPPPKTSAAEGAAVVRLLERVRFLANLAPPEARRA
jgi:predicted dehydrogenase